MHVLSMPCGSDPLIVFPEWIVQHCQPNATVLEVGAGRGEHGYPDHIKKHVGRLVGQLRVAVEHVLAGIKRVRIVKDRFRNTKARFADRIMLIACGLHNLRQDIRHPVASMVGGCLS
jgi:hypothetical protein